MGEGLLFLLRIIFTVVFFPVVFACAVVFYGHLERYPADYGEFFQWGAYSFVLVFFFVYQFQRMYQGGQAAMTEIFKFLTPLDRTIARVIPVYATVVLVGMYALNKIRDVSAYAHYFLFFAGFFLVMHVLLLARELQEEESSFLKSAYFFRMSVYFVFLSCVVVLLLDLTAWQWTFFDFFTAVVDRARDIYAAAIEKIF
ncbi:MAG: hypothetical protein HZA28_09060 [Candidatus Omnitrophica bacterium]|nr:hypothetical protein [Candidatus Omnitrophota bacterium]